MRRHLSKLYWKVALVSTIGVLPAVTPMACGMTQADMIALLNGNGRSSAPFQPGVNNDIAQTGALPGAAAFASNTVSTYLNDGNRDGVADDGRRQWFLNHVFTAMANWLVPDQVRVNVPGTWVDAGRPR